MDAAFLAATLTLLIVLQGAVRGEDSLCPLEPVVIHLSRGQKVTISYHIGDGMDHDVEEVPTPTRRPFGPSRTPSTNAPLDASTDALDPYEANATSTTPPQPETTSNATGDQTEGVTETTLAGQDKEATVDIGGVNETESTVTTTTASTLPSTSLVNSVETEGDVYSVFNESVRDATVTSETTSVASEEVKGEQASTLGEDLTTQSTAGTTVVLTSGAASEESVSSSVSSESTTGVPTTEENEVKTEETITSDAEFTSTTARLTTTTTTAKLTTTSEERTTSESSSTVSAVEENENVTGENVTTTERIVIVTDENRPLNDQVYDDDGDNGGEEIDDSAQNLNTTSEDDVEQDRNDDDEENVGGEEDEDEVEVEEEVEDNTPSAPSTSSTPTPTYPTTESIADDDVDFNQTNSATPGSATPGSSTADLTDDEALNSTDTTDELLSDNLNSTVTDSQTPTSTLSDDDFDDSETVNSSFTPIDDRDQSLLANLTTLTLTNDNDDYESTFENDTALNITSVPKVTEEEVDEDEDEVIDDEDEGEDEDEDEIAVELPNSALDTDLVKSILTQIVDNNTTQESRDPRELENEALEGDIYPDDSGNFEGNERPDGEVAHADDSTPQFYQPNEGVPFVERRNWDEPVSQYLPQRSETAQGPRADRWRRQLRYHVQPNITLCEWHFKTDPGVPLLLSFKNYSVPLSERCESHHIAVRRSNGYVARWCGNAKDSPSHTTFARHELQLLLYSEHGSVDTGFVAEIQALDTFLLRKAVNKVRPLFTSSSSN